MSLLCIPPGGRLKPKQELTGDAGASPKQGILVLWVARFSQGACDLGPCFQMPRLWEVISKRDYGTDLEDSLDPGTLFGLVEG